MDNQEMSMDNFEVSGLQAHKGSVPTDTFSIDDIKITQEFRSLTTVKKHLTRIPIRKTNKSAFIRTHQDHVIDVMLLELKDSNETYVVSRHLWEALEGELTPKRIFLTIDRQGNLFAWPVKLPGADGALDSWNRSALDAATEASRGWIRVVANQPAGAYDILVPAGNIEMAPPNWPTLSKEEFYKLTFRDVFINDMNHDVIRRLKG